MKKYLYIIIIAFIIAAIFFVRSNKYQNVYKASGTYVEKSIVEAVVETENPAVISFNIPDNYVVTELAPGGYDYLIGISKVSCIHHKDVVASENKCDINFGSMPKTLIGGSIEQDIELSSSTIIAYASSTLMGKYPGYEIIFAYGDVKGYRWYFENTENNRLYLFTALQPNVKANWSVEKSRNLLSKVQKKFFETMNLKVEEKSLK